MTAKTKRETPANNKPLDDILHYLEMSYVGARALDDVEGMCRIERAIAVMKTPASRDVFLPDFEEWYLNKQVEEAIG